MERFGDSRDWFFEKRLGMFVHFGLYAREGWHEQAMWRRNYTREAYFAQMNDFNPAKFSADAWLDRMQRAGMQYITVTAKHCDGFCLWNTDTTNYKITNTPFGRDLIAELAEACHRREVPLCLYFSGLDWSDPRFPAHGESHEYALPFPGDMPDMGAYMAFVEAQLRELLTRYGKIHGLWWDACYKKHREPYLNDLARHLQPGILINNRGYSEGDFGTPERDYNKAEVDAQRAFQSPTEACQAVGMQSWGYRASEEYYSLRYLKQSIDRTLSMGGNYLLNVGPMPDGSIDPKSASLLSAIGDWYARVRESYDAEPASQLVADRGIFLTRRGSAVYVHLNAQPIGEGVSLSPIAVKPLRATLLNDGRAIGFRRDVGARHWAEGIDGLTLTDVPADELAGDVMVARLDYEPFVQTLT